MGISILAVRKKRSGEAKGSNHFSGFVKKESRAKRRACAERELELAKAVQESMGRGLVGVRFLDGGSSGAVLISARSTTSGAWCGDSVAGNVQSAIGFPSATALIPPGFWKWHSVSANIAARLPPMSSPQTPTRGN